MEEMKIKRSYRNKNCKKFDKKKEGNEKRKQKQDQTGVYRYTIIHKWTWRRRRELIMNK